MQEYLLDFKHAEKSVNPRTRLSDVEPEVLTTVLEPGTPGSPGKSLPVATKLPLFGWGPLSRSGNAGYAANTAPCLRNKFTSILQGPA